MELSGSLQLDRAPALREVAARALPMARVALRSDRGLKILVVTDAWTPQVNGVVRTLEAVRRELAAMGHHVRFATPDAHATVPLPTYREIRLALFPRAKLMRQFADFEPDAVHIATEGPLGFAARAICRDWKLPFTTSFHTRFPDYLAARFPFVPERRLYDAFRSFHGTAAVTMVSTQSLKSDLTRRGFRNLALWTRGVDVDLFKPRPKDGLEIFGLDLPRPVFLSVGRVAVEKNLEAFLALDLPGSKVVVGDGPQKQALQGRYPKAHFVGPLSGNDLARAYAASDVFVFPSRTDTFGLVLLEALACGIPVAAYPVPGPSDVIGAAPVGVLRHDLKEACLAALDIAPERCRAFALERSWRASAEQFLDNLVLCTGASA